MDVFDLNILSEKTAERRTVEGRNSEMQSTALKEQGSSLKETAPGMETLKLVHDNTLTSFGYAIENYNAEPTNVKPDFHPAPPLISLNEVESRF